MSGIVKKGAGGGELTDVISMRLSPDDRQLLDSVSALVPVIPLETISGKRGVSIALGAIVRRCG